MAEEEQVAADMQEDEAYVEYDEGGLEAEGGQEEGGEVDVSFFCRARAPSLLHAPALRARLLRAHALNGLPMMLLNFERMQPSRWLPGSSGLAEGSASLSGIQTPLTQHRCTRRSSRP